MTTSSPLRRARAALALLLTSALLLTGCGGKSDNGNKAQAQPSVALPTGNVKVPPSVHLTQPGTTLDFGQAATVAYEPNVKKSSVLSMAVLGARTGSIDDFGSYQLDERTKSSTPYYVQVKVQNVGEGDLSGAAVPLLAVDNRNTLIQPSSFNNRFEKCPSTPLPPNFTSGKSARLCLVYLVPAHGKLVEMSYRPLQSFEPIVWRGDIKPPAGQNKGGKKGGKHPHQGGKKGGGNH